MDSQTSSSDSQHSYTAAAWSSKSDTAPAPETTPVQAVDGQQEQPAVPTASVPSQFDFLPFWFPQQSNIYHAQLLHYNRLISPSRGGGLLTPALPPVVSSPVVSASPRSRNTTKPSQRDSNTTKGNPAGGHGSRSNQNTDKNRSAAASKEAPAKMAPKSGNEPAKNLPHHRHVAMSSSPQAQTHSSSVPSTPHQHARKFSFESREPSPTTATNHSPRSAYSETNSTLPSLRPLPPRLGGCKYETSQINSRRRIPYSVGSDRLEKLDLRTIKNKLTDQEEAKVAKDMRAIFDELLPTEQMEQNRRKLVGKLEKIFNDEWPGRDIKAHLFGSSGNLLCSDNSDVDICITTSWRELEGVCMIADLLARRGMEKVVCISAAKVPIVKIWDPDLGLACDMNVNNTVALENTRMIRTYVEVDPRVRQLAMIVKYWTRRRIVNDAAFGGTLSSYTWICLIIAFLQLRSPPVLPALHQLPFKIPKPNGAVSEFADNLKKLRGFGNKNKSSEADLLFQFFRFFAHEFDYDNYVLSVRLGKLITKTDKKWNYAINNQLCVEEPFNTSRNLGNTADEYSFRGLHVELRRAFDLISLGKLEDACEQFVFPKEEERVWSRPAPQPRPVLLRSSSQSQSGRGGRGNHRGGRHNNNYHRGTGSSRRASSSIPPYDGLFMPNVNMPQDVAWFQTPQLQFQYAQQDLMTQMAFHQENMRTLHLYAQNPAFLQQQQQQQQQGLNQPRPPAPNGAAQQVPDRSRTNSLENASVSTQLRPDLYALYGMNLGHALYQPGGIGYGTYSSSPATTAGATQDYRRSLQRSNIASEAGLISSSSSMRSQSQPASRSLSAAQVPASQAMLAQPVGATPLSTSRSANGVTIPSFMSDDADFDETPRARPEPTAEEDGRSTGFFTVRDTSPIHITPQDQSTTTGIAFGDIANQPSSSGSKCRRLSTDQLPQAILDKRMSRTSRSPSPLRHGQPISTDYAAPLNIAPSVHNENRSTARPLVVNGSGMKSRVSADFATVAGERRADVNESATTTPNANTNDALPMHVPSVRVSHTSKSPHIVTPAEEAAVYYRELNNPSVVANGSHSTPIYAATEDASFRERIAMMNSYYAAGSGLANVTGTLQTSAQQRFLNKQAASGMIAPLDLATRDNRATHPGMADMSHLSPVHEMRTPSPTANRKIEGSTTVQARKPDIEAETKLARSSQKEEFVVDKGSVVQDSQNGTKIPKLTALSGKKGPAPRENGHVRAAKSESDGGWQKAGKAKKKSPSTLFPQVANEQQPKRDSDRKGG